jgi:hypothetical protein
MGKHYSESHANVERLVINKHESGRFCYCQRFSGLGVGSNIKIKKVEVSVARHLRAPPYAAKRKDFDFGTSTA